MLPQVDPGIPNGDCPRQVGDIPFFIFLEQRQQSGQRKYGSAVTGRKTAEPGMRDPIDKIVVHARVKELLGAGHGKDTLEDLGKERRQEKSRQQLETLRIPLQAYQQHEYSQCEKPVSQVSEIDEKNIQRRPVIRVQVDKTCGLTGTQ